MAELGISPGQGPLAEELDALLRDGFVETDGCILLASVAARQAVVFGPNLHLYGDETGFEAFWNHEHIDDWLPADTLPSDALTQTSIYADRLATLLETTYPDRAFIIYVTEHDGLPYVVRFHAVRPEQSPWLADVELCEDVAIMAIHLWPRAY
jgi:hypothetical protein